MLIDMAILTHTKVEPIKAQAIETLVIKRWCGLFCPSKQPMLDLLRHLSPLPALQCMRCDPPSLVAL